MVDPFGLGNIIAEYNGSGTLVNRYAHGYGLIAANDNLYTFDGNGNTSELTNASGQLVNKYLYEPFGGSLYKSETSTNDFEFVGQLGIMNLGNDLLYMRNRFYTPTLGRFMNEDPIGLAGGDVSFYRYVSNDPVNWVDPEGLIGLDSILGQLSKYASRPYIRKQVIKYIDNPSGQRIITNSISGAIGGFAGGVAGGALLGAAATGPFAGFGAGPGAFVGGVAGTISGFSSALLLQTSIEAFGVVDHFNRPCH